MPKIFLIIVSVFLFLGVFPVEAVLLDPATGNKSANAEENIRIIASPFTSTDVVARLNLRFDNATVLDFNSSFNQFGTCYPSGATDNATNVCVDLTKLGGSYIQNGEELGVVRVRWGSSGTATITRLEGTGYYNNVVLNEQLGVAGSYVIGEIPPTALEFDDTTIISILGLALIFIGAGLRIYINDSKYEKI
ncbi:MAG TPA: hypothetical protein PKU95_01115 [Candidatus Dojkabacteria bacterium]|jgi:hypothetical protein|nr:hypothetical protein [Candidatus Dojkabacteria bacterium]